MKHDCDSELLVIVCAHADDAELNAGGLMARWHASGKKVAIIMTTNNCSGEMIPENGDESNMFRMSPDKTMEIRHSEQELAAKQLDAHVYYLNYGQRHYWNGDKMVNIGYGNERINPFFENVTPLVIAARQRESKLRLGDLLSKLHPAHVITHIPIDLDTEHHATASLVWQVFHDGKPEFKNTGLTYFMPGTSCQEGMFDPVYDVIEDITDFFEMKKSLCACHASQMTKIRWQMIEDRAREWGKRIGKTFAEPFKTANI